MAIDGKSLRGSHDGDMPMAHMVSAWHVGAGVTLGQLKTATKSNEITAIPELIKALDLRGAVVTADAMACQREIFAAVMAAKADYIVAVKNNQSTLAQGVESQFADVAAGMQEGRLQQDITIDKDHGRLETRCCVVATDLHAIAPQLKLWSGVRSVVMVESRREFINGRDKGKVTKEWRTPQQPGAVGRRFQPAHPRALGHRKPVPLGAGCGHARRRLSGALWKQRREPGHPASHCAEPCQPRALDQRQQEEQAAPCGMAPRLPAGSAGPSDTTSARLNQAAAPTDAAGARRPRSERPHGWRRRATAGRRIDATTTRRRSTAPCERLDASYRVSV